MEKILIHACCAPCLCAVYEDIENNLEEYNIKNNLDFDVIWYNVNIHPKTEYLHRMETLKQFLKYKGKEGIFLDEYNVYNFVENSLKFRDLGFTMRCEYCYTVRLEKVFEYAKQNGYTAVTTTLLISPYQKHDKIIEVCEKLSLKYGVKFLYKDYRPYFRYGQQLAKDMGLYRQKYCGCIFSEEDRYKKTN